MCPSDPAAGPLSLVPVSLGPAQCRAARGLLDWTQEDLAEAAGVSRSTIRDFEKGRHDLHRASAAQIVAALERGGVRLVAADGACGAGVRLASPAPKGPDPTHSS